jgi:glutathione S-transferase
MSYKLHYSAGSCSTAIHVLLNELNQPYELSNANQDGTKTRKPEFLKISPRGTVPVLEIEGMPIHEGGAIITYLCDTHKSHLLPQTGIPRAKALEALMFCNATLHPAYSRAFIALKQSEGLKEPMLKIAIESINALWREVDAKLAKQKYLAGDEITAGDILMTVIAGWSPMFGESIELPENVQRVTEEIKARPAYLKAKEAESSPQKAAA